MLVTQNDEEIVLIVDSEKLVCQKSCLIQYDYFKTLLNLPFRESAQNEIHIKDVALEPFQRMIDFVHGKPLQLDFNNLLALLSLSDQFLVEPLKQECIHYIQEISITKRVELLDMAAKIAPNWVEPICQIFQDHIFKEMTDYLKEAIENHYGYAFKLLIQKYEATKQSYTSSDVLNLEIGRERRHLLDIAIEKNQLEMVAILLEKGVDTNYLFWFSDGYSCVLMLNEKPAGNERPVGLDINTLVVYRDNANLTAYWIETYEVKTKALAAAEVQAIVAKLPSSNQKSIDKDLIQAITSRYGCTVSKKRQFFTPLSFAAFLNHKDAVNHLLSYTKIDTQHPQLLNIQHIRQWRGNNAHSLDALRYAVQHDNIEIAEMILQNKTHELQPSSIITLFQPAFEGNGKIVKLLMEYGADPMEVYRPSLNVSDNCFHYAARNTLSNIIVYLLAKPQGLTVRNQEGKCPLHLALEIKHKETVALLFQHAPLVCDGEDRNILHYICLSKTDPHFLSLVQDPALCQKLSTKDKAGRLPIHYAMEACSLSWTHFLIDQGLLDTFAYSHDYFDAHQKTPFDLACDHGAKDFVFETLQYLLNRKLASSSSDTSEMQITRHHLASQLLHWAAKREYYDIVQYLVKEQGADVNLLVAGGDSFLHWAARKDRVEVVRFLIEHRADINHQNDQNRTALHEAAERWHSKSVKVLLESGCKASFWDKSGRTALQLAEASQNKKINNSRETQKYEEIIELLERSECALQ
jgi:ankyrin repeat protein